MRRVWWKLLDSYAWQQICRESRQVLSIEGHDLLTVRGCQVPGRSGLSLTVGLPACSWYVWYVQSAHLVLRCVGLLPFRMALKARQLARSYSRSSWRKDGRVAVGRSVACSNQEESSKVPQSSLTLGEKISLFLSFFLSLSPQIIFLLALWEEVSRLVVIFLWRHQAIYIYTSGLGKSAGWWQEMPLPVCRSQNQETKWSKRSRRARSKPQKMRATKHVGENNTAFRFI